MPIEGTGISEWFSAPGHRPAIVALVLLWSVAALADTGSAPVLVLL